MTYAIVAYQKKGRTQFYQLSMELDRKEAVAAAMRWTNEEIGHYLPKNTWMLKLFEITEIDFLQEK